MKEYLEALKNVKEKIDESVYLAEYASKHLQEIIMSIMEKEKINN